MLTKPVMPTYTPATYGEHDHITDEDIANEAAHALAMSKYRQAMREFHVACALDAFVNGPDAL